MTRRLPVAFAPSAKADLENLAEYVALVAGSYRTALKFVSRIEARCEKIADAPRSGRSREDIWQGLRTIPFEHSAVIAYLVGDDAITIVHVFSRGRDYEALLRGTDLN